jgi:hypothetical protein
MFSPLVHEVWYVCEHSCCGIVSILEKKKVLHCATCAKNEAVRNMSAQSIGTNKGYFLGHEISAGNLQYQIFLHALGL